MLPDLFGPEIELRGEGVVSRAAEGEVRRGVRAPMSERHEMMELELSNRTERSHLLGPGWMRVDHLKRRRPQRFDARRNGRQRVQNPYELRDLLLGAVLGASQHLAQVFAREMRTGISSPVRWSSPAARASRTSGNRRARRAADTRLTTASSDKRSS
jgi:hypothetical protein